MRIELQASPRVTSLLGDGLWRQVELYELCSGSEGYSSATLLRIRGAQASGAEQALVTMLLREVVAVEGWGAQELRELRSEDFVPFVLTQGYLGDPSGWPITEAELWDRYSEIVAGIRRGPAFHLLDDGDQVDDVPLLRRSEIVEVRCFSAVWNEFQALLRLSDGWAYFTWGTSV